MSEHAEAELLARLLARDEDALRQVVESQGPVVYGMARRVLGDSPLAEEVAQDTFLALWRRPGSFDPARGTLRGFLLGVARNKAVDAVRKEERLARTKEAVIAEVPDQSSVGDADETIMRRDEIKNALASLSNVQREALVLAYFGGRTYREVAEELGIPEGTAKTRMRDGLVSLRRLLERSRESR